MEMVVMEVVIVVIRGKMTVEAMSASEPLRKNVDVISS